jgi:hypothetical protein
MELRQLLPTILCTPVCCKQHIYEYLRRVWGRYRTVILGDNMSISVDGLAVVMH